MKSLASGEPVGRSGLGFMRHEWVSCRRFFEQRSPYTLAASFLAIASLAFGIQQFTEIRSRTQALSEATLQLDAAIAQSRAQLATLSATPHAPASPTQRPPLSEQGNLVAKLQKLLQHPDVNAPDVVFAAPAHDKDKSYWQQDMTVKLSGSYAAVTDLLLSIPQTLSNVALVSTKLTRETHVEGHGSNQIECEAVLRAYFAESRSDHAAQP